MSAKHNREDKFNRKSTEKKIVFDETTSQSDLIDHQEVPIDHHERDAHSPNNQQQTPNTNHSKTDENSKRKNAGNNETVKYTGDVYQEKKHGNGTLSWSDGRFYQGSFYADQRHGFGTFQSIENSEFHGLYRHDERFGPGILIQKSSQTADVGFWLGEDLIRILYRHPNIELEFSITDQKSPSQSSLTIPSWYSAQELLSSVADFDWTRKKKLTPLFCENIRDDKTLLTNYLIDKSHTVEDAILEKRAQLDAYVDKLTSHNTIKEQLQTERVVDVGPPNETYEQRQLFNYTNKFLPLKTQAKFAVEHVLSNARSTFPDPGPLETASLSLFESSFKGDAKSVRDLLMYQRVYADVSDACGFTALHFATYTVNIPVVNLLLDFGANVNQLTDDGLTPLTIAFLLYYGNDPLLTKNLALEHADPVLIIQKQTPVIETARSKERAGTSSRFANNSTRNFASRSFAIEEEKIPSQFELIKRNQADQKNTYGYEMNDDLREHILDESFRNSVTSLIKVLLRRGADPTMSDWPLPVLALAVRAGDLEMVELLIKKKVQVNCRLNERRLLNLTPLHIACGCITSSVTDIARILLEHGADVNAETLPIGKEYFSLADQAVLEARKITDIEGHGRTPIHIACTRDPSSETFNLVRLLLEYGANPNTVCNGQTALSLAIIMGNESLVNLILDQPNTDPSVVLGLGNGNALCVVLSTLYESRWPYTRRIQLIERLILKNQKVLYPIRYGPRNSLGSCVDYAHYSFFADTRISQTPFHALNTFERASFNERKELLSFIAKRFREEVSNQDEFLRLPTPVSDRTTQTPSTGANQTSQPRSRARSIISEKTPDFNLRSTGLFHFCATCGRSIGVRLTPCKRCQKVCFCSKPCKTAGWNSFHRIECQTPEVVSPIDRAATTTQTESSKNKLPSIRPTTKQTELSQWQSIATSGTRLENNTMMGGALFKESVLGINTPQTSTSTNRLANLSVAKLIRQQRLKRMGRIGGLQEGEASSLGNHFSWNPDYHAPENYSFN